VKNSSFRVRRVVRELQLILSVGCALLILDALLTSTLVLQVPLPTVESGALRLLLSTLLTRGMLLGLAPLLCFGVRRVVDVNPWRLGLGSAAFVELALVMLRVVSGDFDAEGFEGNGLDLSTVLQVAVSLAAGALAALAARSAARRVAADEAAQAAAAAAAAPPAPDLAEQMRQIQDSARAAAPSASEPGPAPTGTEPPKP
jgi:hypothetical protein